jgi:NADH-quinone oxidoreductase subunit E
MQSTLIPLLQDVQSELGYLPEEALERVSQLLRLPTSHIYGVVTFYHQFRLRPKGRHMITVCRGTACHVKGSLEVNELVLSELGITPPTDTSKDGVFTLQQVRCVGACSLAPVMKIDDEFYGNLDPAKVRRILSKYRADGGGTR